MALAVIALVRTIEADAALTHRNTNGMYRLKLSGHRIYCTYERLFEEIVVGVE